MWPHFPAPGTNAPALPRTGGYDEAMRGSRTGKIVNGARIGARTAGAAGLGWIAYSRLFINHRRPIYSALEAPMHHLRTREAGTLAYYVERGGGGPPLVLLHSINAAASSYEMRPLFECYRGVRTVFALDLPGFGFSSREQREYTPDLYATAISAFLDNEVKAPADVVALSLTSEFAARAALARPDLFRSLALISPTGFSAGVDARPNHTAYRAFSFPLWSQAFYDFIVSRPSIRYFLNKSFEGPVDEGLVRYAYETSHRPGARFAPLYFIAGLLFTPNVLRTVYERVGSPVLVLYDIDAYVSFERLPELTRTRPNWRAERIPGTRGLPHFDKSDETAAALESFWAEVNSGAVRHAGIPAVD